MTEVIDRPRTAVKTKTRIDTKYCVGCEDELVGDACVNLDCLEAHDTATRGATRKTAKATTKTGDITRQAGSPRAFTRSGRVD